MHVALLSDTRSDENSTDSSQHEVACNRQNDEDDDRSSDLSEERRKKRKPFPFLLVAIGILFLVIGSNAPSQLDRAVEEAVWKQLRMDNENTPSYKAFVRDTIPPPEDIDEEEDTMYLKFRIYDIENAHLIGKRRGEKLKIVEKGPYIYQLTIRHVNATFFGEDTGDFPRSHQKEIYYKPFQQVRLLIGGENGGRDDSELVTQLSMPYQAVLAMSKTLPSKALRDLMLNYFLGSSHRERREKLFVTKTAREILFGYHENFGKTIVLDDDHQQQQQSVESFPEDIQSHILRLSQNYPKRIGRFRFQNKKFAGFDYPGFVQNFSSADEVNAKLEFDGQRVDRAMMHTFMYYQGSSDYRRCAKPGCPPLWGSREANRVLGSDGKFWGGKQHLERVVFLPELVRSAKVVSKHPEVPVKNNEEEGESVMIDGIKCRRWRLDDSVFANAAKVPSNKDYYATETQPNGLFYMGPVLLDIPIYASKPRYLDADSRLRDMVDGMPPPTRDEHDVTFDVHEETGISVLVSERFQYVLRMDLNSHEYGLEENDSFVFNHNQSSPMMTNMDDIKHERRRKEDEIYVPIFWFETIELMSNKHRRLFRKCDTIVQAAEFLKLFGTIFGILCLVLGCTIGTDRAEQDAKRAQAKAVYDHLPIHYHHHHHHHRYEDEAGVDEGLDDSEMNGYSSLLQSEHSPAVDHDKRGIALLLSSKSLRDAWLANPPVTFCINAIIQLVQLRESKWIGVWTPYAKGETSMAVQLILTSLLVGIFVSISGVAVARAAFVRGEVPRRQIPFEPFRKRTWWAVPWTLTDHACGVGVIAGLVFLVCWAGTALLLLYLFVCGSSISANKCDIFWLVFVVAKSFFAAIEAAIVFPLAALRALDGSEF